MSETARRLEAGPVPFGHGCHEVVDPLPGLYAFWARGACLYVGMTGNLERRILEHEAAEDNPALGRYFGAYPGEIKVSIAYVDAGAARLQELESEAIAELRPLANARGGGARA